MASASRILRAVLLVLALSLASAWPLCAQTWTPTTAPITNWTSVACSANGSNVVAAVNGGYLYTSSDFVTWTAMRAPVAAWQSVTMSADGTKVFAVVAPGLIYTSMDSGATWS